ncbi:protein yippee-like At5g53940 isoform X1 [Coffea arabica]|uniref:Protein yippee-like n=1 Tax=Coffea arabica TaxID=13443 RepID=A0ABM4UDA4_COFAR
MGRIFVVDLEGRTYKCKFCKTHLALAGDLVSRGFHSRRGKAYLFSNAVNISVGPREDRMMLSGMHTVADIYCCRCGQIVGWKYVSFCFKYVFACLQRHFHSLFLTFFVTSNVSLFTFSLQEAAHEKSQKYKEGKFVLERGGIMDGLDSEFYIDTRPSMSDAEDA